MLQEMIAEGFGNQEDYNCAEKIFYGANKAYNMGLDAAALKLSAAFGGGMGIESVCGALTGGVMALSSLYVKERGHESSRIKELTRELFANFKQELGEIECAPLKSRYRTPEEKCNRVILAAAKALDAVVEKHGR